LVLNLPFRISIWVVFLIITSCDLWFLMGTTCKLSSQTQEPTATCATQWRYVFLNIVETKS
jgi:hypothetical protein